MNRYFLHAAVVAGITFTFGLVLALTGGAVLVASASPPPNHKVTICHATGSNSNPYVVLTVDVASAGLSEHGHNGHIGPIWVLGDKAAHVKWGDIIPPYSYLMADGTTFVYAGMNWSAQGQAIWANGCALPGTTAPSTTPTAGSSPTPASSPTAGATPTPGAGASPSPTPTGDVLATTATVGGGGVLADTGSTTTGQLLGLTLVALGMLGMAAAAIAWRRPAA